MKKLFAIFTGLILLTSTAFAEVCTMVRASHILVNSRAEAIQIKKDLDKGANFEQYAKKYSLCPSGKEGGDLNFFTKGQMIQPFSDVAFSLKRGEISEPVKTEFGWHIIKVTQRVCE